MLVAEPFGQGSNTALMQAMITRYRRPIIGAPVFTHLFYKLFDVVRLLECVGGGMDVSVTEIHLRAATTGISYRMNCMLPLLSRGARFVTPAEIQGAIGGYMDLKVAP